MSTVEIKAGRAHTAGNKLSVRTVLIFTVLIVWAFVSLFPVYWMLTFSLKNNSEIFGSNVIGLPNYWAWENYDRALHTGSMGRYFLNSLVIAVIHPLYTYCGGYGDLRDDAAGVEGPGDHEQVLHARTDHPDPRGHCSPVCGAQQGNCSTPTGR